MPVDFSSTAIAAGQNAFATPANFLPAAGDVIVTSNPAWEGFELTGGVPNLGRGVFDEGNHDLVFDSDSVGQQTVTPTIGIRLAEFTRSPAKNDRVQIPIVNSTYIVMEARPDSHGGVRLLLQLMSVP